MKTERESTSDRPGNQREARRALVYWPITLVTITVALFLIADAVSAWGPRSDASEDGFRSHVSHFIARKLDRLLDDVEASDVQKSEIRAILESGIDEVAALRGDRERVHSELAALLTAATIDRDGIESMRQAQIAHADEMSRVVSQRLADAMDVLTVEQRVQLEEQIRSHRDRRGHRHHGWH